MKSLRKVAAFLLCIAMIICTYGCAGKLGGELVDKFTGEDTKWIDESATKIGKEITSGQFVLDGVVYEFPMDLKQWLDNGWHVSNNYSNKDNFTLNPGATSTEFELYNTDNNYVRVSVLNDTNSDAKLEDCMVYSLYMSLTEVDVVFPQGISKRNKPAEIITAYGEPLSKGDSSEHIEALYSYTDDDSRTCYVELGVYDNNYTIDPFTSVKYTVLTFDTVWNSLVKEEGDEKACEFYVDAVLNACYKADFKDYVESCIDSQSGAEELYQSEVDYFAECLMYYVDVNTEYLTDEDIARFDKIAKSVLAKVDWSVKSVNVNPFNEGTMVLELYPTNFFDITYNDISDAINNFSTKYADIDLESISDAEYIKIEQDYADMMLDAMEKNVSNAGTLSAVEKTFDIDMDEYVITTDDWMEIDDIIMNVIEE